MSKKNNMHIWFKKTTVGQDVWILSFPRVMWVRWITCLFFDLHTGSHTMDAFLTREKSRNIILGRFIRLFFTALWGNLFDFGLSRIDTSLSIPQIRFDWLGCSLRGFNKLMELGFTSEIALLVMAEEDSKPSSAAGSCAVRAFTWSSGNPSDHPPRDQDNFESVNPLRNRWSG